MRLLRVAAVALMLLGPWAGLGVLLDPATAAPEPPILPALLTADAGADQVVFRNSLVTLTGNATSDSGPFEVAWSQVSGPPVVLNGADQAVATLTPSLPGSYTFRFTVVDPQAWGPAVPVEGPGPDGARYPVVGMDASGTATSVWAQWDGGTFSARANRDNGSGWGVPEWIENAPLQILQPFDIEVEPAGNAAAVWLQAGSFGNDFRSNDFDGTNWGSVDLVENSTSSAGYGTVDYGPPSVAMAVWSQVENFRPRIWASRWAGGTWGAAVQIENLTAGNAGSPDIAMDGDGRALAVWQHMQGGRLSVWSNRFDGSAWGTPVSIETVSAGDAKDPRVALDSAGRGLAVWRQSDGSQYSIWANRYDGGWGTPELVETSNLGDAEAPRLAIAEEAGTATAVWVQPEISRLTIWSNRFDGSNWGVPESLATNSSGGVLSVAVDMGSAASTVAVWTQFDGTYYSLWANRANSSGWSTAELIELEMGGDSTEPDVAVSLNGEAVAVWGQAEFGVWSIFSNRYGATSTNDEVSITVLNRPPSADAGPDRAVPRNVAVYLDGTGTDPDGDMLSYLWEPWSGPTAVNGNLTQSQAWFLPTVPGTNEFRLTVSDPFGGISYDFVNLTAVNQAPVASAGPDLAAYKNEAVVLTGTSMDADADSLSFLWTQVAGPLPVTILNATSATADFLAPTGAGAAGTYLFRFDIADPFGENASDDMSVGVLGRPPVARAGPDQSFPAQGVLVFLVGSGSFDLDSEPVGAYAWTQVMGPPVTLFNASAGTASFVAVDAASYQFELVATDVDGSGSTADETNVTVGNAAPVAFLSLDPNPATENATVTFNASASTDPDGSLQSFAFDFGDGNVSTGTAPLVTWTYPQAGTYAVSVTVEDDDGALATSASITLTVQTWDSPPTAVPQANPTLVVREETILFTANGSMDDVGVTDYEWDFGDGTPPSFGMLTTHAYALVGNFVVTLTVADTAGQSDNASVVVVVANRPPIADAGTDQAAFRGQPITLDAAGSFDLDLADSWTASWVQISGPTMALVPDSATSVRFTPSVLGTLAFRVAVQDNLGGMDEDTVFVSVQNRNPSVDAGVYRAVEVGATVVLDGSGWDPDGDAVSLLWEQVAGPPVVLSSNGSNATFTAEIPGEVRFKLVADDGNGATAQDFLTVLVLLPAPTLASPAEGEIVTGGVPLIGNGTAGATIQLRIDGGNWLDFAPVGPDRSWASSLDTLDLREGGHALEVRQSLGGITSPSLHRSLTVREDRVPPATQDSAWLLLILIPVAVAVHLLWFWMRRRRRSESKGPERSAGGAAAIQEPPSSGQ